MDTDTKKEQDKLLKDTLEQLNLLETELGYINKNPGSKKFPSIERINAFVGKSGEDSDLSSEESFR